MGTKKDFEEKIIGAFGVVGAKWLEGLDETVSYYTDKWELVSEGPVENLSYNYVLRVRDQANRPLILKLGVPNFDFANECRTLQFYDGASCVQVIKEDALNGAFLLDRIVPGNMLLDLEEKLAVKEFAKVWKRIRRPIQYIQDFPLIQDWFHAFDHYLLTYPKNNGPLLNKQVEQAKKLAYDILDKSQDLHLLHGDLHHQNILYSDKDGWTVIDPKGVIGDSYFDLISFLVNELLHQSSPREVLKRRVDILVKELNLDRERLLLTGYVMSTLYACWAVEDKTDWQEANQCAEWFQQFLFANK